MDSTFFVSYEKELADTHRLIDVIQEDNWIDSDTIIVNCSPDYSSTVCQIVNHKLSHLNKNELFEMLFLEMPYPTSPQVWNRDTKTYEYFDRYLLSWVYSNVSKDYKYLFIDSATVRGKNFQRVKDVVRTRIENENFRFASLYMHKDSIFIPDYSVQKYEGGLVFQWENFKNPNWGY